MNYYMIMESPIDPLLLTSDGKFLTGLYMEKEAQKLLSGMKDGWQEDENAIPFKETLTQLNAYFAGKLHEFDLPLKAAGTPFQEAVWRALTFIPYGKTVSYRDIAEQVNLPKAARAVGMANGRNPISIIIPCHRVIGANGKLTGYGGGVHRKEWLLEHEHEDKQATLLSD